MRHGARSADAPRAPTRSSPFPRTSPGAATRRAARADPTRSPPPTPTARPSNGGGSSPGSCWWWWSHLPAAIAVLLLREERKSGADDACRRAHRHDARTDGDQSAAGAYDSDPTTTPTTTPSTPGASTFTLPEGTKLQRGEEGDPALVEQLQQALSKAGYDPGPADGNFGRLTEAAVVAFQEANGLSVDGRVGPETASALNSAVADG